MQKLWKDIKYNLQKTIYIYYGDSEMKTVGETLREWRKSKLYTQEYVANRLKISTTYLHKIEKGESYPSPDLTRRMEQFYNCSWDEIKKMVIDEKVNKHRTSLRKKYMEKNND